MSATFFDSIPRSFADVPIDNGIQTKEFIEASKGLVMLFDILGSTAFAPVKSDMNGNITKIEKKFQQDTQKFSTLQSIIKAEDEAKENIASEGLQFTNLALKLSQNDPKEDLNTSFSKAYENTLKKHHSILLALKATPSREKFYPKLGTEDQLNTKLGPWLSNLDKIVDTITGIFKSKGLEK